MPYLDAFIGDTDDEIFDELIMHLIDALDAETEEDRDMSVKMLSMGLKALIAAASSNQPYWHFPIHIVVWIARC